MPGENGLTPFEMMYVRPYVIPQFRTLSKGSEEAEESLATYMRNMLNKQNVLSINNPHVQVEGEPRPDTGVEPGAWVFILVIKKRSCADLA